MYTLAPFAISVELIMRPMPYRCFAQVTFDGTILENARLTEAPPVTTATTPRKSSKLWTVNPFRMVFASAILGKVKEAY